MALLVMNPYLVGRIMTEPEKLAKIVGKRLAAIRKEQGMTQAELADAIKLSQQLIAEYEAGKKNIPLWRLVNMAEALGVETGAIICANSVPAKRGPPPKLQRQMERIVALPREQQRSILQVLDMALKTAS